jgi:hypothetical protein
MRHIVITGRGDCLKCKQQKAGPVCRRDRLYSTQRYDVAWIFYERLGLLHTGAALVGRQNHDLRADVDAVVEVDHVLVVEADAA